MVDSNTYVRSTTPGAWHRTTSRTDSAEANDHIRVLVIGQDKPITERLVLMLDQSSGMNVTKLSMVDTRRASIAALPKFEVAIFQVESIDFTAAWLVGTLMSARAVKILMLVGDGEIGSLAEALDYGVSGILRARSMTARGLAAAVHACAEANAIMMDSGIVKREITRTSMSHENVDNDFNVVLSRRQQQIIDLMADGFSQKEIGQRLGLSDKTVHTHIARLRTRMGVRSVFQVGVQLNGTDPSAGR